MDEKQDIHSLLHAVPDLEFLDSLHETGSKISVYRGMYIYPVGADTGLSRTTEFAYDSSCTYVSRYKNSIS